VNEADKEGLLLGDSVVMLTSINGNDVRVYGTVTDISKQYKLSILIEKTVVE